MRGRVIDGRLEGLANQPERPPMTEVRIRFGAELGKELRALLKQAARAGV